MGILSKNQRIHKAYPFSTTPQQNQFSTVERGRKWPTPIRRVSHFCPSQRLFCSAVFHLQNVLTEPLKKSVLNWAGTHIANYCIRNTNQYRLHLVSQRRSPVFFHAFYDIFENLIECHHFYHKTGDFPTEKARKSGWLSCQFRPILPPR